MKIIFLNIWGGHIFEPLTEFITEHAESTDFFCFQEVFNGDTGNKIDSHVKFAEFRPNILGEISEILPGFNSFYSPTMSLKVRDLEVAEGLAIFSKKEIKIDWKGQVPIHKKEITDSASILDSFKDMQYVGFAMNGKNFTLCNFHGIAYPGDKLDSDDRINQSRKIAEFLNAESGDKILGGDFNLLPQTESVSIIESAGMRDLIKEFKIASTRSDSNYKKYSNVPNHQQQDFADFVFVSPNIEVKSFEVPRVDISDHLPLILETK